MANESEKGLTREQIGAKRLADFKKAWAKKEAEKKKSIPSTPKGPTKVPDKAPNKKGMIDSTRDKIKTYRQRLDNI